MLRALFIIFLSGTLFGVNAESKYDLVAKILTTSSVQISIDDLPGQLSQFPFLIPVEGRDKERLANAFLNELSMGFNEAEALTNLQTYMLQYGNISLLQKTLEWLNSTSGQAVTQAELLSTAGDDDFMRDFIVNFQPSKLEPTRLKLLSSVVERLATTELLFNMLDRMMPVMLNAMVGNEPKLASSAQKMSEFKAKFNLRMAKMRQHLEPMLSQHMLAVHAYIYRGLSDTDLTSFAEFATSEAGIHYIDLINEGYIRVSVNWITQALPNIVSPPAQPETAAEE